MGWSKFRPLGLVHSEPQHAFPGYTLFTTTGGNHATLVDMEGRICHRWQSDEGISHAEFLDNGNMLIRTKPPEDAGGVEKIGGSCAAILELDWDGNVVWEHRNDMLHHDMERLPNGNTMLLMWEPLPEGMTEKVKGGKKAEDDFERMLGELVREITPDGKVVYEQ